jgi:hypothetical protein
MLRSNRSRMISGLVTLALMAAAGDAPRLVGAAAPGAAAAPSLLFHLSGDRGTTADFAAGESTPNFESGITTIPDGARGGALECAHTQLLAYRAPGNIYAQRGTLSFYWRSREPVGPTEFPIFRVGYADHSSWDMVFLRIDYNGHGFDAFVTDVSLVRTRVSVKVDPFPGPKQWTHLALAWDETTGIRFYVNGKLAASKATRAVYDAALDQFGPHSRIISPYQVQSAYNFMRGGDIDEVRIHDRALDDTAVATLATPEGDTAAPATAAAPAAVPGRATASPARDLAQPQWRDEWWHRYGWDRTTPAYLAAPATSVRKVEILEARDLKRWVWKGTDGIRETTWPGVYNRSRLPGRTDYFVLPDWDCYSLSGKTVTFTLPEEAWNHLEIAGAAFGTMSTEGPGGGKLFDRAKGEDKSVHHFAQALRGGRIRFDNAEQETPIGELVAANVTAGREPAGTTVLSYALAASAEPGDGSSGAIAAFVRGRHAADERQFAVATVAGAARPPAPPDRASLPLVHVVVPNELTGDATAKTIDAVDGGLDGIAIDLPAFAATATHQGLLPLNIRVKDPNWPLRDLIDFTFSVKPGEGRTLWLDTRDRILPAGKAIYFTVAAAGGGFGAASLDGAAVRLVFKPRAEAAREHVTDRFTQVRDLWSHVVEERPRTPKYALYNRLIGDLDDVLRVDPAHQRALEYRYDIVPGSDKPPFAQPVPPAGTPLWAFRQVELLRRLERFVTWWIDQRQIENGEFGGGLSDDGDLTNYWPGTMLMGVQPEKVRDSLLRGLEAFYDQGMFTNGLSTIQTDELHSYEEGIQALAQALMVDYGSPTQIERAMETTRGAQGITAVNGAGHRHVRSTYFSGSTIATDSVWGGAKFYSYLFLHPSSLLVEFNGHPAAKQWLLELSDGLLAHRRQDKDGRFRVDGTIRFDTDEGTPVPMGRFWSMFWMAYAWTGKASYLTPLEDEGAAMASLVTANVLDRLDRREAWRSALVPGQPRARHAAWQLTGDKTYLEALYAEQIEMAGLREYINTEGHLWSDRVNVPAEDLQRARLGGVALVRNAIYPGHTVSWRFTAPAQATSVALLLPDATPRQFTVLGYNLEASPVQATMTAWQVEPGQWQVTEGFDANGDDRMDEPGKVRVVELERSTDIDVTFAPRTTTILSFRLVKPGTPYWTRPDLGIDARDVKRAGNTLEVTVHNVGAVRSPEATVGLVDAAGKVLATAAVPPIDGPLDLRPKTVRVSLTAPAGTPATGVRVVIDPQRALTEITRKNNVVGM